MKRHLLAAAILAASTHQPGIAFADTPSITEDDFTQMPVVVVSATGYQQELLKAPASLTVLERETLQSKAAPDLAETFRDIPGITLVDSAAPGMKRISLRGESARRVLIKVNGQPLSDHSNYGTPLLIDVDSIERIEVVRGSASVVHGSNAVGGVVNITTRQPISGKSESFVSAGYYSATQGYRTAAGTLGAAHGFDWRLQASHVNHNDRETPNGKLPSTDSNMQSISAELGFQIDNHQRISWQGDLFQSEVGAFTDPASGVDYLRFPERDSIRHAIGYEYHDDTSALRRVSVLAYHHDGKRIMDNAITTTSAPPAPPFTLKVENHSDDDLLTQGFQSQMEGHFWADNATVIGVEYQKEELDTHKKTTTSRTPTLPTFPRVKLSDQLAEQGFWSGFLQQQMIFSDSLEANLGARYYNIRSQLIRSTERTPTKDSENEWVGSASLIWQPEKNTTYRINIAQGYTYPSVTQQFAVTAGGSDIHFGNPDLKSEKSTTLELGVRHKNSQIDAEITLYASKARDFIDRSQIVVVPPGYTTPTTPSQRLWLWDNVDKAFSYGVEASMKWQMTNSLHPYANMASQHRRFDFGNGFSTWRSGLPAWQLRSGIEWAAYSNLTLDAYARSYGKSRRVSRTGALTDRNSSYIELNLAAEYRPSTHWSFSAVARNLGNRSYENPEELPAAGRSLDVEMRWRF